MAKAKKTRKVSDYQRIMFGMVALVALVAMIGMITYSRTSSDQRYGVSGEEQGFLVQEVDLDNNVLNEWYEYEDYTTESLSGVATRVPSYCKDSDGGWNYAVKGTVTKQRRDGRIKIKVDKCKTSKNLLEWACSGKAIRRRTIDCSKEWDKCSDGACIASTPQPVCGNRIVEPGEECDGNYRKCTDANGNPGFKNCTPQCRWGPCFVTNYCGDGIVSSGEECDGNNLAGKTCVSLGYVGGSLSCTSGCRFDTRYCVMPSNVTCTDSDGGLNYYVAGGVWGLNGSVYYNMTDVCNTNRTLFEYYCDNGPGGTHFHCPNGCYQRRCMY